MSFQIVLVWDLAQQHFTHHKTTGAGLRLSSSLVGRFDASVSNINMLKKFLRMKLRFYLLGRAQVL